MTYPHFLQQISLLRRKSSFIAPQFDSINNIKTPHIYRVAKKTAHFHWDHRACNTYLSVVAKLCDLKWKFAVFWATLYISICFLLSTIETITCMVCQRHYSKFRQLLQHMLPGFAIGPSDERSDTRANSWKRVYSPSTSDRGGSWLSVTLFQTKLKKTIKLTR